MKHTFTCHVCCQEFPDTQRQVFDGQTLCPQCLDLLTIRCRECGARLWTDDNAGSETLPLCQSCYEEQYTNCCLCGELIRESETYYDATDEFDERPYCSRCFHAMERDACIHDYYYKPEPVFYGSGPRYFGVELEIDGGGESTPHAVELLSIANREGKHAYIKHDGSLEEGLEIVTHPMSLEYQQKKMPWEAVCRRAAALGYLSHRAGTCGLHVHISRAAFGKTEQEQDAPIARVLYFFEKHWEELLKFSRRTQRQLERWAARYGYREQPRDILDHAKKGCHAGRYTCVNLTNRDTVEFRMFRGTLKVNTIIATLQLLDRICDVAISLSDDEVRALSWTTFVSGCTQPELLQYLKERRLYVNEPVGQEEEI